MTHKATKRIEWLSFSRDVPQRLGIAMAKFVEDLLECGNHLVVARACSLEPKRDAQPGPCR
jgi:hypothetical protein